jgi:hypothetical protein
MTFEEICKLDSMVLALYQEATAFRVLSETGQRIRIWDAERAAKLRPDPEFCRTQLFNGIPRERGEVGLKHFLKQRVGYCAQVPELRNESAYQISVFKFLDDMPKCNHAPDKLVKCEDGGVVAESECSYSYPVPPGTCDRNAGRKGLGSLIERLRNHDGRQLWQNVNLEYLLSHPKQPESTLDISPIDDKNEPVFLVKSEADAKQLVINLEIVSRWKKHELSTWYARNAISICDESDAKKIIKANLEKENIIGGLGWKPIVLTFCNPKLSAKLTEIGLAITEMDSIPESLESFRNTVVLTAPSSGLQLEDMPESVLDGRLGEICRTRMADLPRAFAWPALLAVAGALVDQTPDSVRTNLYVGLIGDPGTGKTTALKKAIWLLGMQVPVLVEEKFGSGEGLAQRIGNVGDSARLWCPDELGHTMAKAQIQNATFPETLTTAWSTNQNNATIARQKLVEFSCRLSIAGGLVTDRFGDAFGSAATGGLWDRFIFGECPSGFAYTYRPNSGSPERQPPFDGEEKSAMDLVTVEEISSDVWDERDRWVRAEGINRRVCENALRVATICAAWDGRKTLRAADLGPALEFARYQEKMRGLHKPNPGRNESGIVYHRLTEYLEAHSPDEEWLEQRRVVKNTHVYDFGMGVVDRVFDSMESNGAIERKKQGRKRMVRKRI